MAREARQVGGMMGALLLMGLLIILVMGCAKEVVGQGKKLAAKETKPSAQGIAPGPFQPTWDSLQRGILPIGRQAGQP